MRKGGKFKYTLIYPLDDIMRAVTTKECASEASILLVYNNLMWAELQYTHDIVVS